MFDRLQYLAAFGSAEELHKHVALAKDFIGNRQHTVIVQADHMPIWLRLGSRNALYADWEKSGKNKGIKQGQATFKRTSQKLAKLAAVEAKCAEAAKDQTGQKRGATSADESKVRVCLEARQAILNWLSIHDPVGVILKSVFTVQGAHARASNIADNHTWIKTERFYVGGKLVVHEAGAKTECLWWFIELRPKFPELFKHLVIFPQPSAVHDEITHPWDIEDIKDQFALVLNLQDLLHVGFTQKSKAATRLYQQINAWIAGGMTPVLQWVDTDGACDAKIGAEVAKRDMITELKDQAKAVGKEAIGFKLDTYGILKIVNAAHDKMVD